VENPSAELVRTLVEYGLCTPEQLRRCRGRVRRLARDVPAFDSVWVDALVQAEVVTPFQAGLVTSTNPERLCAGPCLLIDRAGSDGRLTHFRARFRQTGDECRLTFARQGTVVSPHAADNLRELAQRGRTLGQVDLGIPTGFSLQDEQFIIVSPRSPGHTLDDLLVRRGRFPADLVAGIARQLAAAMVRLHDAGVVHGDLRLRNLRVTCNGRLSLEQSGVVPALWPELSIHAEWPPECFSNVAPELVGTRQTASVKSDLYAFGCVLWELLVGRPVFPHGDGLARLAAHQTKPVPDVQEWAPDTPAELARMIAALTHVDPEDRPDSVATCLRAPPRRRDFRRMHALVESPIPRGDARQPKRGFIRTALATTALIAACFLLLHSGARTELLAIVGRTVKAPTTGGDSGDLQTDRQTGIRRLPQEIRDGVITLEPGEYLAAEVAAVGPLTIRGGGSARTVILVDEEPLEVWAETLVLTNVELRRAPASAADQTPLVVAHAQQLGVTDCLFQTRAGPAISWAAIDESPGASARAGLARTQFCGEGSALVTDHPPAAVLLDNVLKLGAGCLVEMSSTAGGRSQTRVDARQTTLRNSGSLLRIVPARESGPKLLALMTLENCVVDLAADNGLVEFSGGEPPRDWQQLVQITGENSLVRPDVNVVGLFQPASGDVSRLDASQVVIDGLLATEFQFAGPESIDPRDSCLTGYFGYARSDYPPGIRRDEAAANSSLIDPQP